LTICSVLLPPGKKRTTPELLRSREEIEGGKKETHPLPGRKNHEVSKHLFQWPIIRGRERAAGILGGTSLRKRKKKPSKLPGGLLFLRGFRRKGEEGKM